MIDLASRVPSCRARNLDDLMRCGRDRPSRAFFAGMPAWLAGRVDQAADLLGVAFAATAAGLQAKDSSEIATPCRG
jgi:hypothetical protein